MRHEQQQQQGGVAVDDVAQQVPPPDHAEGPAKFTDKGSIPPVAADVDGGASVSASDRGYGSGAPHDGGTRRADSLLGFDPLGAVGGLGKPRVPTTTLPMTKEGDLAALAARKDAESLLLAKGVDTPNQVARALELIVNVPDGQRGKVIDELNPKAFENLLEFVSDDQRERFYTLVEVSQNPERKLRLWADAHKARAANNVEREKADIGKPIVTFEQEHSDGSVTEEVDEDEEEEIRDTLTKDQRRNRKRHMRRQAAAKSTKTEVDAELKDLLAQAKKGQLTMKDVDEVRERKELEYRIEHETNVNLTEPEHFKDGSRAQWTTSDLQQIERTLQRLPQMHSEDSVGEIRRTVDAGAGVGGVYHGEYIEVTGWGLAPDAGFRHGGDTREMVSEDFKKKNGEKIGTAEFVLTHEIGHDVAEQDPKAFAAFQKAAGWTRVKVDAVRDDGVSDADIATLENRRANPNIKTSDIEGRTKIFSPISDSKDEYWSLPQTAVPAQDEAAAGPRGEDTWDYGRVNPSEHFAEVYAKAVHVPEKLHDELIVRPTEAAAKARGLYEQMERQIASVESDHRSPNRALRLANLKPMRDTLKADMLRLEAARQQRAEEFAVMRNSVFGTDKAVKLAVERLKVKKISGDKLREFQERATHASTPEQVAYLEAEVSK